MGPNSDINIIHTTIRNTNNDIDIDAQTVRGRSPSPEENVQEKEKLLSQLFRMKASVTFYAWTAMQTIYMMVLLVYCLTRFVALRAWKFIVTLRRRSSTVIFALFYFISLLVVRYHSGWAIFHPSLAILVVGLPLSFFCRRHLNSLVICTVAHMEWELYEILHHRFANDDNNNNNGVHDDDPNAPDTLTAYSFLFLGSVVFRLILYVWEIAIVYENIQHDLKTDNAQMVRAVMQTAMPWYREVSSPLDFTVDPTRNTAAAATAFAPQPPSEASVSPISVPPPYTTSSPSTSVRYTRNPDGLW